MKSPSATYDLPSLQAEVAAGRHLVTLAALQDAGALGFDRDDICECVLALGKADFYKTMPSNKRPGTMQDVYRTTYCDVPMYVKLQHHSDVCVISFKRDENR